MSLSKLCNAIGQSDMQLTLGYDSRHTVNQTRSGALEQNRVLNSFLSKIEKRAFRIAQIATSNSDDALDIVQDAMFKLVEKYADKSEDELGALFHRILQSRIHDWYRRNTVRNRFRSWLGTDENDEDKLQQAADPAGRSPLEELQVNTSIQTLEQALRALPLRQQQAFLLRAWEGMDVRQTAKAMSCAEGSVKTHYSRAIHTLRDKLGEHWYE